MLVAGREHGARVLDPAPRGPSFPASVALRLPAAPAPGPSPARRLAGLRAPAAPFK
jgi:hypothetical protein